MFNQLPNRVRHSFRGGSDIVYRQTLNSSLKACMGMIAG
jgi:hypothetical protein